MNTYFFKSILIFFMYYFTFTPTFIFANQSLNSNSSEIIEANHTGLPFIFYLNGIGTIFGGAYLGENIIQGEGDIIVGASFYRLEAQGVLIKDIPYESTKFGFGFANISNVFYDNSFTRNLDEEVPIRFRSRGRLLGGTANYTSEDDTFLWNNSLSYSSISFREILDKNDEEIFLPNIFLGDLEILSLTSNIIFSGLDNNILPTNGVSFTIKLQTNQAISKAYTSTINTDYILKVYVPIVDRFEWVFQSFFSRSYPYAKTHDNEEEVRGGLNIQCNTLSNLTEERCNKIAESMVNYITKHNQLGTATTLGGNRYMRSFREGRFRAANSIYASHEYRYTFENVNQHNFDLQLAIFDEFGNAQDKLEDILEDNVRSYGFGMRFLIGELAIRLDIAKGDEGTAGSLILGSYLTLPIIKLEFFHIS